MYSTHKNFAIGIVSIAPSPATSGTTFTLNSGDGNRFEANMPIALTPPETEPAGANSEIAYITNVAGDVVTMTRAQEGSTAKEVASGWIVRGTITAKLLTDIETNKVEVEPGKGLSTNDYTTVEKTKLAGIASGATQNASDAALRDRTTHTGSQAIATVTGLQTALDSKLESDDVADFETTTELNARDSANRSRSNHTGTQAISTVSGLQTALDSKATPADVSTAVAGLVDAAPGTLDTLNELAAALGDDPNFATTVTTQIGTKADASALTSHTSNTSNPHSVTKAQVGLGNVDNTSDANKPVSTATQTALDTKVQIGGDLGGTITATVVKSRTSVTVGASPTVADFVTDGVADSVEIQAAVDAVNAAGGGVVYLRRGTYNLAATVNLKNNVSLIGEGWSSTKIVLTSNFTIKVSGQNKIRVSGLRIDANAMTAGNVYGFYAENCTDIVFDHNYVENASGFGVFIASNATNITKNVWITDNYVQGKGTKDVIGGGPANSTGAQVRDVFVERNIVIQDSTLGASHKDAVNFVGVYRIHFNDNTVEGSVLFGSEQFPHRYSVIQNNIIKKANGAARASVGLILDPAHSATGEAAIFMGNTIECGFLECYSNPSTPKYKSVLIANNVINATGSVTSTLGEAGIVLVKTDYPTVSGNNIFATHTVHAVDSSTDINASTDVITRTAHGLETGQPVLYTAGTGTVGGLTTNTIYYVMRVDGNSFKLATTQALANAGTAIDLTSTGTGTQTFALGVVDGIWLKSVTNANVSGNTVNGMGGWAYKESDGSDNNFVIGNTFGSNALGTVTGAGANSVIYGNKGDSRPIPIAYGGTGGTSATTALNGLLPSQPSNGGKVLQTDGTNASWQVAATGTVTSVGLSVPTGLQVSGSPVTGAGTLAVTYSSGYQGYTAAEATKLAGIETAADVTDAANVSAAGAVMESDTSTTGFSFVVDEDNMASNSDTKVPTQQSVKNYVDVVGASKQPLDTELTAIAGLTSVADSLPYFTGSGTASLATFTSAGRALVDDADVAAQRTTLGLGNVDNTSDANKPVSTAQLAAIEGQVGTNLLDTWRKRPFLYSDFLSTGTSQLDPFLGTTLASGTIGSPIASTVTASHPGVVRVASSTTTNSGGYVGTNTSQLLLGGGEVYECIFNIGTLTDSTFRVGFHDTATSADATDGCYVEIDSGGIATGKTANNSTRSSTGTTYTLSTSTWYRVRITVTSTSSVTYEIFNDSGTQLWTDLLTTNIPSAGGRECGVGFMSSNVGTTAVTLVQIDYMSLTWSSNLTR